MFVLTTENHLQAFQRAKHAFTGCHCLQNKQSMQHWRPHCLKPWNMVLEDTHLFKSTSVFPKNLKPDVVYCWLLVVDVVLLYFVLRVRNTTSSIAIEPYSYCFLGYCIVFVTDAMFVSDQYCFVAYILKLWQIISCLDGWETILTIHKAKVTLSLMFVFRQCCKKQRSSFVLQFLKLLLEF